MQQHWGQVLFCRADLAKIDSSSWWYGTFNPPGYMFSTCSSSRTLPKVCFLKKQQLIVTLNVTSLDSSAACWALSSVCLRQRQTVDSKFIRISSLMPSVLFPSSSSKVTATALHLSSFHPAHPASSRSRMLWCVFLLKKWTFLRRNETPGAFQPALLYPRKSCRINLKPLKRSGLFLFNYIIFCIDFTYQKWLKPGINSTSPWKSFFILGGFVIAKEISKLEG